MAGMLLTRLMAKAMNRSIKSVLFSNFGGGGQAQEISGAQKPIAHVAAFQVPIKTGRSVIPCNAERSAPPMPWPRFSVRT